MPMQYDSLEDGEDIRELVGETALESTLGYEESLE